MKIDKDLEQKIKEQSKEFQTNYKYTSKTPPDRKGEGFSEGCKWMHDHLSNNNDGGAGNTAFEKLSKVQSEYIDLLERSLALTTPIFWKNHGVFTDGHVNRSKQLLTEIKSIKEELSNEHKEEDNRIYL